jgi:hypothetical protein
VGSLSEQERVALDDVFLSLAKKTGNAEKLQHKSQRLLDSLHQIAKKGIPLSLSYVKSKKIVLTQGKKMYKSKLSRHILPKNRGSK